MPSSTVESVYSRNTSINSILVWYVLCMFIIIELVMSHDENHHKNDCNHNHQKYNCNHNHKKYNCNQNHQSD